MPSFPSMWKGREVDIVVNARIANAPEVLESIVRSDFADEAKNAIGGEMRVEGRIDSERVILESKSREKR